MVMNRLPMSYEAMVQNISSRNIFPTFKQLNVKVWINFIACNFEKKSLEILKLDLLNIKEGNILAMRIFKELVYGWFSIIFRRLLFVKFQNLESMVWSSLDISKKHSIYNFLISKVYLPFLIFFFPLIITSFPTYFLNNYFLPFLVTASIFITTSFLFPTHQHGYEKKFNMCLSCPYNLYWIKLNLTLTMNYWTPYENIRKKESWSSLVVCSNGEPKLW
jgi:hypothetical protein